MGKLKLYLLLSVAALFLVAIAEKAQAQIAIEVGPPPVCPYGYFDYPPYDCAPYGYYGSEWFINGVFIGAGPWYHGPGHFWGHVDNHFDRNDGFRGEYPHRGEHHATERNSGHVEHFHGNEMRDGHGHSNLGRAHEHGGHPR